MEAPLLVQLLLFLIAVFCFAIGIHYLRMKPVGPYVWVNSDSRSKNSDNLPPYPWNYYDSDFQKWVQEKDPFLADEMSSWPANLGPPPSNMPEIELLVAKYLPPSNPNDPASRGSRSMRFAEERHLVPEGGGWIIEDKLPEDGVVKSFDDVFSQQWPEDIRLLDRGNSYVIEIENVDYPPAAIKIVARKAEMEILFPIDFEGFPANREVNGKPSMKVLPIVFEEETDPNRAWADLWIDVLRVTVPKDMSSKPSLSDEHPVNIIVRDSHPPPLPPVPEAAKYRPHH